MTMHRRTVELTCSAVDGHAEEDVSAYPTSSIALLTRLHAVRYAGDQLALTVSEVDPADEDDEDAEDTPGAMLLHVFETDDKVYYPRVAEVVDQDGAAIANEYVPVILGTTKVRIEVDGPALSTATVELFYETAGDQRF